ncbi:MAG: hypothetical protein GXP25_06610 [Planctomycetes bacterium]|nr:hypothetical protein [Planctomycetota bacterium]
MSGYKWWCTFSSRSDRLAADENEPVLVDSEGNPKGVNRLPYETFKSSR